MTPPAISLIICVHNPTDTFRRTLLSIDALKERDRCEIILVENACTEQDRLLIDTLTATRSYLWRTVEARPGLSLARNRGIQISTAPVIAFIDDDAELAPDWVEGILSVFDTNTNAGAVGGKVLLEHLAPLPAWIEDIHRLYMGAFDCGEQIIPLSFPHYPRGLNMAFLREALESTGGFTGALGKTGKNLLCFEEIDVCYLIAQNGWDILYAPAAVATHLIESSKLEKSWYTRRAFAQGQSVRLFERVRGLPREPLGKTINGIRRGNTMSRSYGLGYLAGNLAAL